MENIMRGQASMVNLTGMEPMYLRDVKAAGTNSPFTDLIRLARREGADYPQIWHIFAFKPVLAGVGVVAMARAPMVVQQLCRQHEHS
jgi:hypothetical protein